MFAEVRNALGRADFFFFSLSEAQDGYALRRKKIMTWKLTRIFPARMTCAGLNVAAGRGKIPYTASAVRKQGMRPVRRRQDRFPGHAASRIGVWLCLLLVFGLLFSTTGGAGWAAETERRPSEWAQPVHVEGLPNLHRVSGKLYRSAQPTAEGMQAAERLGIRTVVSLRSKQRDARLAEGTDLLLRHVPMRAWDPHMPGAVAALSAIAVSPGPVLVHCWHGADRTGMVVALYRMVEQGWTREAAIEEMLEGGYGYHSIWKDIITFLETVDVEELRRTLRANAALPCLAPESGTPPAAVQKAVPGTRLLRYAGQAAQPRQVQRLAVEPSDG